MRYCLVWHQAIKNKPESPIVVLSSLTEMCVSPRMHACWFCWMIWQFSVNAHRIAAHSVKLLSVRMVCVCVQVCVREGTLSLQHACLKAQARASLALLSQRQFSSSFASALPPPRDKLCSLWHHHPSGPAATRYSHPLLTLPLSYSSLTPVCRSLLSPPAAHRARPARASAAPRTSPCPRPCSLPLPPSPPEITSPPLKARRLSGAAAPLPAPLLRGAAPEPPCPGGLFLRTAGAGRGPAAPAPRLGPPGGGGRSPRGGEAAAAEPPGSLAAPRRLRPAGTMAGEIEDPNSRETQSVGGALGRYEDSLRGAVREMRADMQLFKQGVGRQVEEVLRLASPLAHSVSELQQENRRLRAQLERLSRQVEALGRTAGLPQEWADEAAGTPSAAGPGAPGQGLAGGRFSSHAKLAVTGRSHVSARRKCSPQPGRRREGGPRGCVSGCITGVALHWRGAARRDTGHLCCSAGSTGFWEVLWEMVLAPIPPGDVPDYSSAWSDRGLG